MNFDVTYPQGMPQGAQAAFARAIATWEATNLQSNIDIKVNVQWNLQLGGLLGMCIPGGHENFNNAPRQDTWYTSALADKLAGADLSAQNLFDMEVIFGQQNFYTGQGQPAQDQYDLESVALHEICHGLGFVGLFWVADVNGNNFGSYGNNAVLGAIPPNLNPQVSLPANLNGHPSAFGVLVEDAQGNELVGNHYANNSQPLAVALTSGSLRIRTGLNQTYPIYSPNPFQPASSDEHFRPPPNSLMVPDRNSGTTFRNIDQPVLNVLTAIGW